MKIVMTMMVRDEIDVIAAVVEHHVAQGVDLIVVTDNGSVDGTAEVLKEYADLGVVELHHDPVHQKQQGVRVTAMARRAHEVHGADWVVNGDADEFLVPLDRSLTVREALAGTPTSLGAFTVPVVNMVGAPAERGSGLSRLVWRDGRLDDELLPVGIHAQPTPNAIHVGSDDVTVSQGNHFVSVESQGQPDEAVGIEVLHLPWRSYRQFEQKVLHAGRAYEASTDLRPSPNHHGMADYRRAQEGRLREALALRLPDLEAIEAGGRFVRDTWLVDSLRALVPVALLPAHLERTFEDADDDVWDVAEHQQWARLGSRFRGLELQATQALADLAVSRKEVRDLRARLQRVRRERDEAVARAEAGEAWVPLPADVRRVTRRVGAAVRRRVTPSRRAV